MSLQELNIQDISKSFDEYYGKSLLPKEKAYLLRCIDTDNNDKLSLDEFTSFFRSYSADKRLSLKLVIILLAKRLEISEIRTDIYFT